MCFYITEIYPILVIDKLIFNDCIKSWIHTSREYTGCTLTT